MSNNLGFRTSCVRTVQYVYMRKLAAYRAEQVPVDPSLIREGFVSFQIVQELVVDKSAVSCG
jgi:hypothetical protein